MQTNKVLYVAVGILIGVAAILAIVRLSPQEVYAGPGGRQNESFASGDYIAIASTARSDNNILWFVDTKAKKLLLYEYYNENVVRLKCVRDLQYDLNVPDAVAIPDKNAEPSPNNVKKVYDEYRKAIEREQRMETPR